MSSSDGKNYKMSRVSEDKEKTVGVSDFVDENQNIAAVTAQDCDAQNESTETNTDKASSSQPQDRKLDDDSDDDGSFISDTSSMAGWSQASTQVYPTYGIEYMSDSDIDNHLAHLYNMKNDWAREENLLRSSAGELYDRYLSLSESANQHVRRLLFMQIGAGPEDDDGLYQRISAERNEAEALENESAQLLEASRQKADEAEKAKGKTNEITNAITNFENAVNYFMENQ